MGNPAPGFSLMNCPFGPIVRAQSPASVGEYSMGGRVSGIKPQGLSPVVSAEWASFTPAKMLSRMGEAAGTQLGPGVSLFQFQSYLAASISSPGPEAKYVLSVTVSRPRGRRPGFSSTSQP